MKSLTQETESGLSWSALEQISRNGLTFCIQILLARLIAPEEFGLLALVSIIVLFSNLIISAGLGHSLIQSKEISRTDISTVFYSNVVLSFVLYAIIFSAAPMIATYYEEPRLVLLIRWVSLGFVIGGFGQIQNCLFLRDLQFRKLFWITTPAIVISGLTGITMALLDFEVWALVVMQLTSAVVLTGGYWLFSNRENWPQRRFSFSSIRRLGKFGMGILGAEMMNKGVENAYGLVISKSFSFDDLAFYNRARTFQRLPSMTLSSVIIRVLFPVFSKIADDDRRIRDALRRGIPLLVFLLFPAMALLMAASDHIIVFVLTDKWLPAAPLLRWFPVIGMLIPLVALHWTVQRAKGHAWIVFSLGAVKNVLAIVVLILTLPHGVLPIVVGQVVVFFVSNFFLNMPATHFICGYRMSDQLADLFPYVMGTAIAGTASFFVGQWANLNSHFLALTLQTFTLILVYGLFCVLFQPSGFRQTVAHGKSFAGKIRRGSQDQGQH